MLKRAALATLLALGLCLGSSTTLGDTPKPPTGQYAQVARWLVHAASWGTLSTISAHLHGAPYGNAVSYAAEASGRPLFYLTAFDATAEDVAENANATLTVCEMQLLGACDTDPQDPTCAKVSLTGKLLRVPAEGQQAAARAMFSRHPDMRGWPASHRFALYELHVDAVRLLDSFGGAQDINPGDYYAKGAEFGLL